MLHGNVVYRAMCSTVACSRRRRVGFEVLHCDAQRKGLEAAPTGANPVRRGCAAGSRELTGLERTAQKPVTPPDAGFSWWRSQIAGGGWRRWE